MQWYACVHHNPMTQAHGVCKIPFATGSWFSSNCYASLVLSKHPGWDEHLLILFCSWSLKHTTFYFLVYFYQLSAVYKPIEQPLLCLPDAIVLASSYIGLYSRHNILIAELVRIQISHTRNQPTAPLFEGVSPEKLFLQWKYLETPFFPSRPH